MYIYMYSHIVSYNSNTHKILLMSVFHYANFNLVVILILFERKW